MAEDNAITIHYDNLALLVQGSDHIAMAPQGEELLVKLLELKAKVDAAVDQAKDRLNLAMEAIDPTLTSIQSEKVKVTRRAYGLKYALADVAIDQIDEEFYNKKVSYTPNSKAIDKCLKDTGSLPSGVSFNSRNTSVAIKLKETHE